MYDTPAAEAAKEKDLFVLFLFRSITMSRMVVVGGELGKETRERIEREIIRLEAIPKRKRSAS